MCSEATDIHCAACSHLDLYSDTHAYCARMGISVMSTADITCLSYIQTSQTSWSNSPLCCTLPTETRGLYWLIKAHHLNCAPWLRSCGVGARWDNDAQLSEHILWLGWHSEQQLRHRAHQIQTETPTHGHNGHQCSHTRASLFGASSLLCPSPAFCFRSRLVDLVKSSSSRFSHKRSIKDSGSGQGKVFLIITDPHD